MSKIFSSQWRELDQKLKIARSFHVAFFVPDDLVKCSRRQSDVDGESFKAIDVDEGFNAIDVDDPTIDADDDQGTTAIKLLLP